MKKGQNPVLVRLHQRHRDRLRWIAETMHAYDLISEPEMTKALVKMIDLTYGELTKQVRADVAPTKPMEPSQAGRTAARRILAAPARHGTTSSPGTPQASPVSDPGARRERPPDPIPAIPPPLPATLPGGRDPGAAAHARQPPKA